MKTPLIIIGAVIALGFFVVLLPVMLYAYQRFSRKKVVTCPKTTDFAEIDIDARYAVFSSVFGNPILKVKDCTLWPEKKGCSEHCLRSASD